MKHSHEETFAAKLIEHLVTATFVLNAEGKVIIWNNSLEELTGVPASEMLGTKDHWKAFYSEKRMCLSDVVLHDKTKELPNLYKTHEPHPYKNGHKGEIWCLLPRTEKTVYLTADAGPVYDNGKLIAVVQTIRDNSSSKKAQTSLEEQATKDELTGLNNRRYFNEHLNIEWARCARNGTSLSLILFDVDYFKQYNDNYGHIAGDKCLKAVASMLKKSSLRGSDIIIRYGGEEFCMLLPNTDLDGALKIAQRARSAIAKLAIPHIMSDVSDFVTLSDGISCIIPSMKENPLELVKYADDALYKAKSSGRNQSVEAPIP